MFEEKVVWMFSWRYTVKNCEFFSKNEVLMPFKSNWADNYERSVANLISGHSSHT